MQPVNLAPKFDPYIINNQENDLHLKLDGIFQNLAGNDEEILSAANGFQPIGLKNHVVTHPDLPDWIIKGPRHDDVIATLPDTHIYRVRKAARIQSVIDKHGFSEVVVPKKMLYQHGGHWFVIAEKLKLDEEVVVPNGNGWSFPGKTERDLNAEQAKEIATLCFEGKLEDVGASNLNFTQEGKIALIDTEPVLRALKKSFKSEFSLIPNMKATILFKSALTNSERLYMLCSSEVGKEVRKVQSRAFWKHLCKVVVQVSIPLILSIGALHLALASAAPIILTGLAVTAVVVSGANALNGLFWSLLSIWSYHRIRSVVGHYELAMARG